MRFGRRCSEGQVSASRWGSQLTSRGIARRRREAGRSTLAYTLRRVRGARGRGTRRDGSEIRCLRGTCCAEWEQQCGRNLLEGQLTGCLRALSGVIGVSGGAAARKLSWSREGAQETAAFFFGADAEAMFARRRTSFRRLRHWPECPSRHSRRQDHSCSRVKCASRCTSFTSRSCHFSAIKVDSEIMLGSGKGDDMKFALTILRL